eukprot:132027_1
MAMKLKLSSTSRTSEETPPPSYRSEADSGKDVVDDPPPFIPDVPQPEACKPKGIADLNVMRFPVVDERFEISHVGSDWHVMRVPSDFQFSEQISLRHTTTLSITGHIDFVPPATYNALWRMKLEPGAQIENIRFAVESLSSSSADYKHCEAFLESPRSEIPVSEWFLFPVGKVIVSDSGDELPLNISISQTDSELKSGLIIDCFMLSREPDSEGDES